MYVFTTKHIEKHRLKDSPNYVFSKDGLCYNIKTNRVIKQIVKGSTIGYIIKGKFKSLTILRENLELIPKKEFLPF